MKRILVDWMPDYLQQVWLQNGPGVSRLPEPKSWNVREEADRWSEDMLPSGVIVCPGLESAPVRSGDGWWSAPYRIGVVVFCSGNSEHSVRQNASIYAAAVRAILLQQRDSVVFASVKWDGEHFTDGPADGNRSIGASTTEFIMTLDGVINDMTHPDTHDQTSWGVVRTTNLTVTEKT